MPFPPLHIVDVQPGHPHTHTIILLHGRSSTATQFASDIFSHHTSDAGKNLASSLPTCRWVFPSAGQRWCTASEEKKSAWFDLYSLTDTNKRQDLQEPGLKESVLFIKGVVEDEVDRLEGKSERVALGGFSLGGATSLCTLLSGVATNKGRLGAFLGFSPWLPFANMLEKANCMNDGQDLPDMRAQDIIRSFQEILGIKEPPQAESNVHSVQSTPVFIGHGTDDKVIDISLGRQASDILSSIGVRVDWKEYSGAERDGHWVKEPEEFDDVVTFLKERLDLQIRDL